MGATQLKDHRSSNTANLNGNLFTEPDPHDIEPLEEDDLQLSITSDNSVRGVIDILDS